MTHIPESESIQRTEQIQAQRIFGSRRLRRLYVWLGGLPLIGPVVRHRFIKFGSVGFSGTLINLGVLYLGQEFLFAWIDHESLRLNLSLALAIFTATLNNFYWNRRWTWRERKPHLDKSLLLQLAQYFMASWLAIAVQVVITNILAAHMHYMLANVSAIVFAAAINYLINDRWTFRIRNTE